MKEIFGENIKPERATDKYIKFKKKIVKNQKYINIIRNRIKN